MPKADATGLAPKKSADHNPPVHDSLCGRVWLAPSHKSSLFLWCSSLSGGLGPKTRRPPGRLCRAFRIGFLDLLLVGYRSCLHRRVSYPTRVLPQHRRPVTQERNPKMRQGKKRTPSGENSVTRYSRRRPLKPAKVYGWQHCLNRWILPNLANKLVSEVGNGALRQFVEILSAAGLAPKTIVNVVTVVKFVVASAVDEEGDQIHPRV